MLNFKDWSDIATYVQETEGITFFDDPIEWVQAMQVAAAEAKYTGISNDDASQDLLDDMVVDVGEAVVTGSGTISAPTARSVVTDAQGGVDPLDPAVGVKNNGIVHATPFINVLTGLLQVYGLVQTGIDIANSQVWKDMSNYVFDTEFTEETPLERVIDFLITKTVNAITTVTTNGDLVVNIPDSIAEKLYNFLKNHMVLSQVPGIEVDPSFFVTLETFTTWHDNTLVPASQSNTLARYFSCGTPTDELTGGYCDIGDDLFKFAMNDFCYQAIGSGFALASNTATALLASLDGTFDYLLEQSSGGLNLCELCVVQIQLIRSQGVGKEIPISMNEITVNVFAYHDHRIKFYNPEPGVNALCYTFNGYNAPTSLAAGSSYAAGDCMKYLKRGYTGELDTDYAYRVVPVLISGSGTDRAYKVEITYPANEKTMTYTDISSSVANVRSTLFINGFNRQDNATSVSDTVFETYTSNVELKGDVASYEPDDYLVTAGFKSNGKNPDPTKTKEQQYEDMATKKYQANPSKDDGEVTNRVIPYIPTCVPAGWTNAQRIIDHGTDPAEDPAAYQDNRPQQDKSKGYPNTQDPVDGFNQEVEETKGDYNDSRQTPDTYPDSLPENVPNPQYPDNPPDETSGDSGNTPTPSTLADITVSNMVSIYNPTKVQIQLFSSWLWSNNFFDNFVKIFQNPMDAIIALHVLYATPISSGSQNICVGYLDSGVSSKVVTQQFSEIDCGTVTIPEYYGNAIDYEPYTQIHVYLPFIGIVSIKPNDVIGKQLNIKYGIDALTGTCLATLTTIKGTSRIVCYTFAGNCAVQLPISGGNYAQVITSLAGFMASGIGAIATANPLMALGAGASLLNTHLDVSHSGAIGSNAGVLGIRKPYVIITRKSAYEAAGYKDFYGFPANKTVTLNSCKGYTRVKSVHIDTILTATDNEKREIETLLKEGVIIE